MALMWLVLQVFVTFLYWDLPRLRLQENLQQEQAAYNRNSLNEPSLPAPALENQSSLVFPPTPGVERKTLEQAASLPRPTPSRDFDSPVASSNQMIETVERYMGTNEPVRELYDEASSLSNYGSMEDCEVQSNGVLRENRPPNTAASINDGASSSDESEVRFSRVEYFFNGEFRIILVAYRFFKFLIHRISSGGNCRNYNHCVCSVLQPSCFGGE